jgi:hypothetical protein
MRYIKARLARIEARAAEVHILLVLFNHLP